MTTGPWCPYYRIERVVRARPVPTQQETDMQPTDQASDFQVSNDLAESNTMMSLSGVKSPSDGIQAPARHRSVYIRDARFPFGRVFVLAWDVVCHGGSDLSTMLCRSSRGDYFLRHRWGNQPGVEASIVPLSSSDAAVWFDRLPVHLAPRDAQWQRKDQL